MVLDGSLAQGELLRDIAIRATSDNRGHDLELPRREAERVWNALGSCGRLHVG
jgi:hypothetical protein